MHYAGMLPNISPRPCADRGVVNMGRSVSIYR
jgi:hypothetical protein